MLVQASKNQLFLSNESASLGYVNNHNKVGASQLATCDYNRASSDQSVLNQNQNYLSLSFVSITDCVVGEWNMLYLGLSTFRMCGLCLGWVRIVLYCGSLCFKMFHSEKTDSIQASLLSETSACKRNRQWRWRQEQTRLCHLQSLIQCYWETPVFDAKWSG